MGSQRFDFPGLNRIGSNEASGHPCCTQLSALQENRIGGIANNDFQTSAAQINDQMRALLEIDGVPHAQIDQTSLIPRRDDAYMNAQLRTNTLDEFAAVLRLTDGAGGDGDRKSTRLN